MASLAPFRPGSSPHTRGAPDSVLFQVFEKGIIPAYAGSTAGGQRKASSMAGSSPHTRGARSTTTSKFPNRGIIPAYAGSTTPAPSSPSLGKDHPRIRGEHALRRFIDKGSQGSSPHTRGALAASSSTRRKRRIIPAYAGSTEFAPYSRCWRRDHPRIRGEHRSTETG